MQSVYKDFKNHCKVRKTTSYEADRFTFGAQMQLIVTSPFQKHCKKLSDVHHRFGTNTPYVTENLVSRHHHCHFIFVVWIDLPHPPAFTGTHWAQEKHQRQHFGRFHSHVDYQQEPKRRRYPLTHRRLKRQPQYSVGIIVSIISRARACQTWRSTCSRTRP